jgi:transcriptional regulator with XRE-family HTH domain
MTLHEGRLNTVVAEALEAERKELGIPKAALARHAGMSLSSLRRYLEGEREMTLGTVDAIATGLRLDPDALVAKARKQVAEER